MAPTTYDDANLLMQIMIWGDQRGTEQAGQAIFGDDFDPETVSIDDESVRKVLGFFEVTGTFVKQGVLDAGLVYDMWTVATTWGRLANVALRMREKMNEPRLWENFELLAKNQPK